MVLDEMCREYQSYDSSSSGDVDVTDLTRGFSSLIRRSVSFSGIIFVTLLET